MYIVFRFQFAWLGLIQLVLILIIEILDMVNMIPRVQSVAFGMDGNVFTIVITAIGWILSVSIRRIFIGVVHRK